MLASSEEDICKFNGRVDKDHARIMRSSPKSKPVRQKIPGYIYVLHSGDLTKIGRTKNLPSRMSAYTTENPHKIEIVFIQRVPDTVEAERALIEKFRHLQVRGEWHSKFDEKDIYVAQKIVEKFAV